MVVDIPFVSMKINVLSALVCTASATPLLQSRQSAAQKAGSAPGDLSTGVVCVGPGGRVADVPGAGPARVEQKSDSKVAGARRVKLRYGDTAINIW